MAVQWITLADLGGGLNLGPSIENVQPNQQTQIQNFYPYGTVQRRRQGNRRITNHAWNDAGLSMSPLRKSSGSNYLIVGGLTKFGRQVSDRVEDLIALTTLGVNPDYDPWSQVQYKNYQYAARNLAGKVVRIDGNSFAAAGIPLPGVLPILADPGGGSMIPGTYYFVYTFGNQATQYEGLPAGPISVVVGAGGKISVVGMDISSDPFVDMKNLYISFPDQPGMYYLAQTINDNSTTATSIDIPLTSLGRAASFKANRPPATTKYLDTWEERLWVADDSFLYYSESGRPESFGGSSIIPVFPDDGYKIAGIKRFGSRLIVGKSDRMYYGTGVDERNWDFSHVLSDRHGLLSNASMQISKNILFWLGTGKTVFASDGTAYRDISDPRVRSRLEQLTDAEASRIQATVNPQYKMYMMLLPGTGLEFATYNEILAYNYESDTWSNFKVPAGGNVFTSLVDSPDLADGRATFLLTSGGDVFEFMDPNTTKDMDISFGSNGDADVEASFTMPMFDLGVPSYQKRVVRVGILMPGSIFSGPFLTAQVFYDETGVASRLIEVDSDQEWRMLKFDPQAVGIGNMGTKAQLKITLTGHEVVDIEKIRIGYRVLGRSPRYQ